ncbi:MAG TPA: glycosyltransferase family 39 protein [Puia sp.]|nr:glycosyltransferase family 39 protein [Puia sp.]
MRRLDRLIYFLAILKFILPFFLQHPVYEPHRDEFLYLAEGQHPAFGYMEVPPLLSVFAGLTQLFGSGLFWIKLWPSLIGTLTFILSARVTVSLGGRTFSIWLLFLSFFFSAFLRVHYLFQPNFLEVFFYTAIAFGLIRYVQTGKNKWLYVAGLSAGLGLLSKYSVAFYLVSLGAGLMLSRQRKIFLNKHLYFAAVLGFLIFLPNLIWQYVNHFPVLHHMGELRERQLKYVSASGFLTEQLTMFLPCFVVWIVGLIFLFISKAARPFIFLGWAYLGVIGILLWFHGKGYYALGLYPILLAMGSYAIEKGTEKSLYFLRYILCAWLLVIGVLFVFIALPVQAPEKLARTYQKINAEKTGFLKWEDQENHPLPQDFADMLGWREAAQKTGAAYNRLSTEDKKNCMIFCDNYGLAGALNFYRKDYQLPEIYSDNASFLYWLPAHADIDNLILLTDDQEEMQHPFIKDFESAAIADSITSPYAREHGALIIVMKHANSRMKDMFNRKIEKDRERMQDH